MKTRSLATIALLLSSMMFAAIPAGATHDQADCNPQESAPDLRQGPIGLFSHTGSFHVFALGIDSRLHTGAAAIAYLETNGVDGFQRADAFESDRHCGHGPDTELAGAGCTFAGKLWYFGGGTSFSFGPDECELGGPGL